MESITPQPPTAELAHRLLAVLARIDAAALRCGRSAPVRLLAVSKQQDAGSIRALAGLGQADFGENYLQEALEKQRLLADLQVTWHFIGQIQSNKTRPVAEYFHWVHTVDRLKIAQRLSEQRPANLPPLQACIQVMLAEEAGKGGVPPSGVIALARQIAPLPNLRLRGLMCIPPPRERFEDQHEFFAHAARLLEELRREGLDVDTLSMGMSADLEAAIAAGATIVRIGSALFGERRVGSG